MPEIGLDPGDGIMGSTSELRVFPYGLTVDGLDQIGAAAALR